jgi:hypothetical protein
MQTHIISLPVSIATTPHMYIPALSERREREREREREDDTAHPTNIGSF